MQAQARVLAVVRLATAVSLRTRLLRKRSLFNHRHIRIHGECPPKSGGTLILDRRPSKRGIEIPPLRPHLRIPPRHRPRRHPNQQKRMGHLPHLLRLAQYHRIPGSPHRNPKTRRPDRRHHPNVEARPSRLAVLVRMMRGRDGPASARPSKTLDPSILLHHRPNRLPCCSSRRTHNAR